MSTPSPAVLVHAQVALGFCGPRPCPARAVRRVAPRPGRWLDVPVVERDGSRWMRAFVSGSRWVFRAVHPLQVQTSGDVVEVADLDTDGT